MKFFALIALIGLTQGIQLHQLAEPAPAAPATPDAGADAAKANEEKTSAGPDKADSDPDLGKSGEEKAEENAKANGAEEKKEGDAKDAKPKDAPPADPAAAKAAEAEPTAAEKAAAVDGPARVKNDSEKDRERMVRIASIGQEAIQNNEKKLDEIKNKYDNAKTIPEGSEDPSVDKKSESSAGYAEGIADAKKGTAKEEAANKLNANTPTEIAVANMNVDPEAPKKEPIIQQTVATNTL